MFDWNIDPSSIENQRIGLRSRFVGICSIVQESTIYQGPTFQDIDGNVWFLASGADTSSIDSWLMFIKLDRKPDHVLDVPPLLAFSSKEAVERRRRKDDSDPSR